MSQSRAATQEREVIYILDPPKPPKNGIGTAGFVFSILGIFTGGLLSPIGLLFSFFGLFKRPRSLAASGFVLSLLGVGFVSSMVAMPVIMHRQQMAHRQYQAQAQVAQRQIAEVIQQIESRPESESQSLDGYEGNAITVQHLDPWGTELRFDERQDGYAVRSAGPDQRFDTRDDLVEARVIEEVSETVSINR
jgi:hypothetical protein